MMLVSELHPGNVWFWSMVSWAVPVRTARVHPTCQSWLTPRLALVDLDRYLPADEAHCFQADVVKRWERVVGRLEQRNWRFTIADREVDFTVKACQDFAREFDRWALLEHIARQMEPEQPPQLVTSAAVALLQAVGAIARHRQGIGIAALSWMNVALDRAWIFGRTLLTLAHALTAWMVACARHRITPPLRDRDIRIFWAAANLNELHSSRESRSLFWIVDGATLTPADVLFVLPPNAPRSTQTALRQSPFRVVEHLGELARAMPRGLLIRSLMQMIAELPGICWRSWARPEGCFTMWYGSHTRQMAAISRWFRLGAYVTSESHLGCESPIIAYLNACQIPTVMYSYSANTLVPFSSWDCQCDFRSVVFGHVMVRHFTVWSLWLHQFFNQHPQQGAQIHVLGPLMAGDETVCANDTAQLRARYCPQQNTASPLKWISVFDLPPPIPGTRIRHPLYATMDPAYATAFLRDIVQWLEEDARIGIILKPHRRFSNQKFAFSEEFRGLAAKLEQHPRAVVLPDTINSWIPIAMADLCVGIPFTSPVKAGWFHQIPGFYHDAQNRCVWYGRVASLQNVVTHHYAQLREKADDILWNGGAARFQQLYQEDLADILATSEGGESSARFREFLRSLIEKSTNPGESHQHEPAAIGAGA